MEQNTARNFALQLGSLITLYTSISAVLMIAFGAINMLFPDAAEYSWLYSSSQDGMRFGIALLIVFFPAFLILTQKVNSIRRIESGTYLLLTKWLVYLSILIGGIVLLGDIVSVVLNYLNGEITARFFLKAAVLAIVLSFSLYYYLKDAQGYWVAHKKQSQLCGLGAIVIVVATLVFGFMYTDSPAKTREMKIDNKQISDFNDAQWRIEDHYRINKALPKTADELFVGVMTFTAPEDREPYEYKIIDEDTYELCATFAHPSIPSEMEVAYLSPEEMKNTYNNWDHKAGRTCFQRSIVKDTPIPAL
jgi:hypothetical protein